MKCSLCGIDFDPETAQQACQHCPLKRGCTLLKCPNCGFELPPEPKWMKRGEKKREEKNANADQ